jgi:hypothetical protein
MRGGLPDLTEIEGLERKIERWRQNRPRAGRCRRSCGGKRPRRPEGWVLVEWRVRWGWATRSSGSGFCQRARL